MTEKTLSLGEQLEDMKKQNMEFHLTALTRLARMHHLLEDIQNRLHYLQDPMETTFPPPHLLYPLRAILLAERASEETDDET